MKNNRSGLWKTLSALAFVGVIAILVIALGTEPAAAKPKPGPLCGPTILWECTLRDGTTEFVGATVCDIGKYEKKNKATCERATF